MTDANEQSNPSTGYWSSVTAEKEPLVREISEADPQKRRFLARARWISDVFGYEGVPRLRHELPGVGRCCRRSAALSLLHGEDEDGWRYYEVVCEYQ